MYKVIFSIFLAATALLLVSSHSGAYTRGNGTAPVKATMPTVINHDSGTLSLDGLAPDRQVAVTLWSSDDAASRAANAAIAARARRDPNLVHVGVNVDESPAMFHELLRRDRLDDDTLQLHVSGPEASRLLSTMGYRTLTR